MKKLLLNFWLLLLCMIAGAGTAWATLPTNPQWVATALSDISDNATVIIISNSNNATNISIPSTATTSNPVKKACEVSTTDGITTITPPDGTELQDLAWTITITEDGYKFYQEGSNSIRLYLTGTSSNTALRVGNASSSNDTFVLGNLGKLLKVTTGSRFVGPYDNNGSDWRTYNTENATNYKGAALTFYVLKETTSPVDLTSFAFSNTTPSVTLSKNGDNYEASYTQTVTVDPDDYDGTITYAIDEQNSTIGENTIVDVDESGVVTILAEANEASTIVVKASGESTASYNAPADATYILTVNAAPAGVGTPTFSLATGSYYYGTTTTITSVNASEIYYTTDGTTPTKSSTTYSGSVAITKTMTLKAIGYDGETASDVASIDYTLKAPEVPTFSVEGGEVIQGSTVTLTPGEGGEVIVYTTDGSAPTIESEVYDEPIAINAAMTIKAVTVDDGENLSDIASFDFTVKKVDVYEKVTDASTLAEGDKVIFVYETSNKALSTTQNSNNRGVADVIVSNNKITDPSSSVQVFELEGSEEGWYFNTGSGYIYAASSGSNHMKTEEEKDDNAKATIEIEDGNATILFQGSNTRNLVCYNSGSTVFSCYQKTSSSVYLIQLYRLQENLEEATVTITPAEAFELNYGGTKVLTVTTTSDAEITATSSDETIATVAKTGDNQYTVTAVNGTEEGVDATITFATAKTATYKAASATIVATVKDTREAAPISFAEAAVEADLDDNTFTGQALTNDEDLAVTWDSSDKDVATVAKDGTVTLVAEGTTTITASFAGNDTYKAAVAQYELTVTNVNRPGSATNPYTVDQAIKAIDNDGNVTNVYVSGIVSTVATSISSGAMSYYISDDGTTTSQLQAYKGKGKNNVSFSATTDVELYDRVTIYGSLTKYGDIYEFSAGNYLISQTHRAANTITVEGGTSKSIDLGKSETSVTLSATAANNATVTFEVDTENSTLDAGDYTFSEGTLTVTNANSAGGNVVIIASAEGDVNYYDGSETITVAVSPATKTDNEIELEEASGSTPYGTPLEVVYVIADGYDGEMSYTISNPAIVDVAIGAEIITFTPKAVGTAVITISAPATATFNAAEDVEYTLTVTAPEGGTEAAVLGEETYTFDFSDNTDWEFPTDYTTGENTYTKDGKTVTLNAASNGYKHLGSALLIGKSGATLTLPAFNNPVTKITTTGVSGSSGKVTQNIFVGETAVSTATTSAAVDHEYEIDSEYRAAGTIYTLKVTNANNTQLTDLTVYMNASITAKLNGSGYATFCSQYPLDFTTTDGYTAWQIKSISGETITFEKITGKIKGGQGILLKGDAGATVTLASADSENEMTANLLFGTTAPTYIAADEYYGLSGNMFKKVKAGVVPAGKALLPASKIPSTARELTFVFEDGGTTGIKLIDNSQSTIDNYYDLQGRKVNTPKAGLYIKNGKKVMIK